ncbi:MAG TPA: ATP-grasp domain-containing protein [Candidatus Limiplasma pullistercoris]|nr:ATP-grasp domain-containing protein [Candidatus Limiplasma pullistercoris]
MDALWLLYDEADLALNLGFVELMRDRGHARGLDIVPVTTQELTLGLDASGMPVCLRAGAPARPCALLSRQRDSLISFHFERMGVPVFNSARVCAICNDKRVTHQFLSGLPMPETVFLPAAATEPPPGTRFPVILKPACSHGGDRVTLVRNEREWCEAASAILPQPALQQAVVDGAGQDLRAYVVHGRIVAGVMRTAAHGVVSNFKRGGSVALHALTPQERALAQAVIGRFARAGAPLTLAGVDLMFDRGRPVVNEVEDVVGSRMLYQTSDIDIVSLFLDGISDIVANAQ